jgi:phospho-N-acetylmuramoyl-pentapeptide-transferase
MLLDFIKVFAPAVLSFSIGIALTPLLTHYLYEHRMWKKKAGKVDLGGKGTPMFNKLHEARETGTPRFGGLVIWFSAAVATFGVYLLANLTNADILLKLDFLSRNQTWIPLTALLIGGCIGFLDDLFEIRGTKDHVAGGLSLRKRLLLVGILGLLAGAWFYLKLDVGSIGMPFIGELPMGVFIIPLFAVVAIGVYSGGIIDGIDGLAGGIFASIFASYGVIAFLQDQINLAAFCVALVGSILAFLWFNIPPARFYMSETGSMALTLTLSVVAFMTDTLGGGRGLFVLPLIAFPLVITSLSVILQLIWRKTFKRKLFLISPLHHHFEALGWPAYKVTMRYWIIGIVCAILGVIVALLS